MLLESETITKLLNFEKMKNYMEDYTNESFGKNS